MPPGIGALIAYLLGGIPAAYLAGRIVRGIDLRTYGSGNLGATNVYRAMGAKVAIPVFAFDIVKGAAAVLLLPPLTASPQLANWAMVYGLAAVAGHVRSPYLGWRAGGKGVATALGVFLSLTPWATLAALVAWLVVMGLSRFVSLASLVAAVTLPVAIAAIDGLRAPVLILSVIVGSFVFWTHRTNIYRLRHGEERRVGHGKPAT